MRWLKGQQHLGPGGNPEDGHSVLGGRVGKLEGVWVPDNHGPALPAELPPSYLLSQERNESLTCLI